MQPTNLVQAGNTCNVDEDDHVHDNRTSDVFPEMPSRHHYMLLDLTDLPSLSTTERAFLCACRFLFSLFSVSFLLLSAELLILQYSIGIYNVANAFSVLPEYCNTFY